MSRGPSLGLPRELLGRLSDQNSGQVRTQTSLQDTDFSPIGVIDHPRHADIGGGQGGRGGEAETRSGSAGSK
jgi:hypothetical protein